MSENNKETGKKVKLKCEKQKSCSHCGKSIAARCTRCPTCGKQV